EVQVQIVRGDQLADAEIARLVLQARERDQAGLARGRADVAAEDELAVADDGDRLERRDRAARRGPAEHADLADGRPGGGGGAGGVVERAQLGGGARRRILVGGGAIGFERLFAL